MLPPRGAKFLERLPALIFWGSVLIICFPIMVIVALFEIEEPGT